MASQLKQKVSSLVESAKWMTLDAANGRLPDDEVDLESMLGARLERERLLALRKIVTMMAKDLDVSRYFAHVVKNAGSTNYEIRKLVNVYLVRYAEANPEVALLAINAIQKLQNYRNAIVRAEAIKLLSSIHVVAISAVLVLAIGKAARDPSPLVRKAAAAGITKCHQLNRAEDDGLRLILKLLLGDRVPSVVAAAMIASEQVFGDELEMLHVAFRPCCRYMLEFDEFTQVVVLRLLTKYSRKFFAAPQLQRDDTDGEHTRIIMDNDLSLLFKTCENLLSSRSTAVLIAVCRVYRHLGTQMNLNVVAEPLAALSSSNPLVLSLIRILANDHPHLFRPHLKTFTLWPSDGPQTRRYKLEIWLSCAADENIDDILRELHKISATVDPDMTIACIDCMRQCAIHFPSCHSKVVDRLLRNVSAPDRVQMEQSISSLALLLQPRTEEYIPIVKQLASVFAKMTNSTAKSNVLWLLSYYSLLIPGLGASVLASSVKSFAQEDATVKFRLLHLTACLQAIILGRMPDAQTLNKEQSKQLELLISHVYKLAYYDISYDLRDRSRLYQNMLQADGSCFITKLLFENLDISTQSLPTKGRQFTFGTTASVIGERGIFYEDLPPWSSDPPPSSIRNPPESVETLVYPAAKADSVKDLYPTSFKGKSMAEFLASSSEAESGTDQWQSSSEEGEEEEEEEEAQGSREASEVEEGSTSEEASDSEEVVNGRHNSAKNALLSDRYA